MNHPSPGAAHPTSSTDTRWRLGVVSFLNAQPLIEGLGFDDGVSIRYDVPSRLPGLLRDDAVDVALVPVVDLARSNGGWQIVSDACIASEAETLTVRVFSRVPPAEMTRLHVDGDSHTSVVLSQLIWSHYYDAPLALFPLDGVSDLAECEAVLLIGDKVVQAPLSGFDHQIDLGGAWRAWTGLPFVFAVWAARAGRDCTEIAKRLSAARDLGVSRPREIARRCGPPLGWPTELAEEYLTQRLSYRLTDAARGGMARFLELAGQDLGCAPRPEAVWT